MCIATCSLEYGSWVSTGSLRFAATAYHRTRGPFLALDLIRQRQSNGTLQAEESGAALVLNNLPDELWMMVRTALLDEEISVAEAQAIAEIRCKYCEYSHLQGKPIWSHWDQGSRCEACSDIAVDLKVGFLTTPDRDVGSAAGDF